MFKLSSPFIIMYTIILIIALIIIPAHLYLLPWHKLCSTFWTYTHCTYICMQGLETRGSNPIRVASEHTIKDMSLTEQSSDSYVVITKQQPSHCAFQNLMNNSSTLFSTPISYGYVVFWWLHKSRGLLKSTNLADRAADTDRVYVVIW